MALIRVDVESQVPASPEKVYRCIADYGERRGQWLPSNYSDRTVEQGGMGDGTVYRYTLTVGRRARAYQMAVSEPQPGAVLVERDMRSSLVTTWTVEPAGAGARVAIHTEWQGSGGVGGFFERTFAPRALKRVYEDALSRLTACATGA